MVKYAVVDVSVCNLTSVDIPVTIMVIPVGGTLSENKYVIEWETTVAPGKPLIRSRLALSPGASIYVFPVVAGTVVNDVIAVSVNGIPKL
jgi:hypothetical protein